MNVNVLLCVGESFSVVFERGSGRRGPFVMFHLRWLGRIDQKHGKLSVALLRGCLGCDSSSSGFGGRWEDDKCRRCWFDVLGWECSL